MGKIIKAEKRGGVESKSLKNIHPWYFPDVAINLTLIRN